MGDDLDNGETRNNTTAQHGRNWALVLLLPPFVGLLYPPFYVRVEPRLGGVPFFLWYQFAWVIVTAVLTGTVYRLRRSEDQTAHPGHGEDRDAR